MSALTHCPRSQHRATQQRTTQMREDRGRDSSCETRLRSKWLPRNSGLCFCPLASVLFEVETDHSDKTKGLPKQPSWLHHIRSHSRRYRLGGGGSATGLWCGSDCVRGGGGGGLDGCWCTTGGGGGGERSGSRLGSGRCGNASRNMGFEYS